jgi:hypothetical protein
MRKSLLTFGIAILLILCGVQVFSQDQVISNVRIAVLPLWYPEEDSIAPLLSDSVHSSIQWTLRFIEGYSLVDPESYPEGQSELPGFIETQKLDHLIYGRVDIDDGTYTVTLLLYDTEKDRVEMVEQGSVSSSLEIFSLADDLSVSLLEKFLGRELEFGSLVFENTGEGPGDFRVYINDIFFGENITAVDTFLSGTYRIKIDQKHEDDVFTVHEEQVTVEKDRRAEVEFRLIRYGYAEFEREGPKADFRLLVDGEVLESDPEEPAILEIGGHHFAVEERRGAVEPYVEVYDTSFTVTEGETAVVHYPTGPLAAGFSLLPEGTGSYRVYINDEPSGDTVEVLDNLIVGRYRIEIVQLFGSREIPVFRTIEKARRNRRVELEFTLYPDAETAREASTEADSFRPVPVTNDWSAEVRGFGGAFVWTGVNTVVIERKLSLSALAGFSIIDGIDPVLSVLLEGAYLLFQARGFEPYAGAAFVMQTDFGVHNSMLATIPAVVFQIGPVVGLSWFTGWKPVSHVFIENGLFYTIGLPFSLGYRFSVGVRLF